MESIGFLSFSLLVSFDRRPTAQKINSANYAARISGRGHGASTIHRGRVGALSFFLSLSLILIYVYDRGPLTIWNEGYAA